MYLVRVIPLIAIVAMMFVVLGQAAQAEKDDLKQLAGAWIGTLAEDSGEKIEDLVGAKFQLVFEGNTLTFIAQKGDRLVKDKMQFRLDPTKKPKHIDLEVSKDETLQGIYSLEGNMLKLCTSTKPENRPTAFTTKKGSGHRLLVFKRREKE